MRAMSRTLFLAYLAVLGCGPRADRSIDPTSASSPAEATHSARASLERAMAASGLHIAFDAALDCVAAGLTGPVIELDPRRYRHELPLACGSPLLVVDARVVTPDAVDTALAEISRLLPGPDPIAVGTAALAEPAQGLVVVVARRTVELVLPTAGSNRLSGELLVAADALRLYQATAAGVEVRDVPVHDRRFAIDLDATAASDLELAIVVGSTTGPVARLRFGAGAGLVDATEPSLLLAVNAARQRLGRPPLAQVGEPGGCDVLPPRLGDVDITDRARCIELWSIDDSDAAREVSHLPLELQALLDPDVAFVQYAGRAVGPAERGVAIRLLRRFEVMTPAEGRRNALAQLRRRWPRIQERATPPGALARVLADLPGPDGSALAALKPRVDHIAGKWTTTSEYYSGLVSSRDLEAVLRLVQPEVTPLAVDLAFTQTRGADGAMHHVVAFVLELPSG
jgi:hypothetical protein